MLDGGYEIEDVREDFSWSIITLRPPILHPPALLVTGQNLSLFCEKKMVQ